MKISIDSVIDNAKFRLGLRDTSYADADLERLIDEGCRHLLKLSNYVISCETISIDCAKAELPTGFTELICFSFTSGGCSGCCTWAGENPQVNPITGNCGCYQYYFANRNVLTEFCGMGGNACAMGMNGYAMQGGYLCFPSTITETEVKVWFRGMNSDSDGIMIIDDMDERGLAAYAAYNYATAGQNYKAYDRNQVRGWKDEWVAQKNMRIAQDFQADAKANRGLWAAVAKSILLNPWNSLNANF